MGNSLIDVYKNVHVLKRYEQPRVLGKHVQEDPIGFRDKVFTYSLSALYPRPKT